jgi:phenylacetate-CoA ligase
MPLHSITFFGFTFRSILRDRLNSPRVIDAYRDQSLKVLLSRARQNVPFQRDRLARIDLRAIQLEEIPPTTKTAMMESFDETISRGVVTLDDVLATDHGHQMKLPIIHGKYLAVKSSGTSGKPAWMVIGLRDWAILRGATLGRLARNWLTPGRAAMSLFRPIRSATLAAEHSHSMTWQSSRSVEQWARPFVKVRFFPVVNSVERIAEGLNEYQPEYLHAYPTAAEMLARYRLDGGHVTFDPELLSVGSEALTDMARQAIREAFPKTQLVDHYGMSECLPLSTECQMGRKHINTDYAILEPVNADGLPTPDGELSDHVLVTNLINHVQPVIRYRVDDSVRISHQRCPCGSVFPTVEVFSRKGSQIHLRSDRNRWQLLSPPVVVDTMLRATGVAQFQVIHVRQNELEVKFIPQKGFDTRDVGVSIARQFDNVLSRLDCGHSVAVAVEQVDSFQRTEGGGKLLQTVSLVAPPTPAQRAA